MGLCQEAGSMAQGNAEALAAGRRLLTGLPASSVPSLQAMLDTRAFRCNPLLLCSKPARFSHFTPRKARAHRGLSAIHGLRLHPLLHLSCPLSLDCADLPARPEHFRSAPASGPLHWLFPLPRVFFPQRSTRHTDTSFKSLLKYEVLSEHPN